MEVSDLIDFFSADRFVPELAATTKDAILNELAEKFVESHLIRNKSIVLEMLHRRESIGSTDIGHGIAIPHGRTTAAPELTIAFGKSSKGVQWGTSNNEPVHLIFLVVAPPYEESNLYLPVLGRLVEFLNNPANRDNLLKVKTFDEFRNILVEYKK